MNNVLDLTIQSVKLGNNENVNVKKKSLRNNTSNRFDLFIKRDGHLIRFSSVVKTNIFIEEAIQAIRNKDHKNVADGTFWILFYLNDVPHGLRVRSWIPRSLTVISTELMHEINNESYQLFISDLDHVRLDREEKKVVEAFSFNVDDAQLTTFDYQSSNKKKILITSMAAILLIGSYLTYENLNDDESMSFNLPVKTVTTKVDTFLHYRNEQANKRTAGLVLLALEPTYIMLRNDALPNGWGNKSITYKNGELTAKILPNVNGISKIGELTSKFKNHPNKHFVDIDGQNVNVKVLITADGGAFSNKYSSLTLSELRDNIIDTMSLFGANEVQTNKVEEKDGYKTQKMQIVFKEVSPLIIGVLSRALANKPIYANELILEQGIRAIDLEMTLVFIEVSKKELTEAK